MACEITPIHVFLEPRVLEGLLRNTSHGMSVLASLPVKAFTAAVSPPARVKTSDNMDALVAALNKFPTSFSLSAAKLEVHLLLPCARKELRNKRGCWGADAVGTTLLPDDGGIKLGSVVGFRFPTGDEFYGFLEN